MKMEAIKRYIEVPNTSMGKQISNTWIFSFGFWSKIWI